MKGVKVETYDNFIGPFLPKSLAIQAGLKRYYTGQPCPKGHYCLYHVSGTCLECQRIYRAENGPAIYQKHVKAYRARNPGIRGIEAADYRSRKPEVGRKAALKHKYANLEKVRAADREFKRVQREIRPEHFQAIREKYMGKRYAARNALVRPKPDVCEVCGELHLRIVYDHEHDSGAFRGWLCDRCNKTLGLVYDKPRTLRALARYIEEFHGGSIIARPEENASIGIRWPAPFLPR